MHKQLPEILTAHQGEKAILSRQKQNERFYLDKFFALLGKMPNEIQSGESPDFIVILQQKRIGMELTDFHSDLKRENDRSRRAIEETWMLLQKMIMEEVGKCNELKETNGFLFFKKLELPPKSKHKKFTRELIKLSLEMLNLDCKEIMPGNNYPFLNKYLKKFRLEKVGCHTTWKWNYNVSFIGLTEIELMDTIKPKIEKTFGYKKEKELNELWLLITSGYRLSQAMGIHLLEKLNTYDRLNNLLSQSGYKKIYLYQYMFDVIYEWPGWVKVGREDSL